MVGRIRRTGRKGRRKDDDDDDDGVDRCPHGSLVWLESQTLSS